uniref:Uncharacterized protein n=1 Tax=Kalanchoe fedtschenkoi TaxID=63787 RepID=A0A7N0TAW5_KALFE
MAPGGGKLMTVSVTSPKGSSEGAGQAQKGHQCLCSPTTHQGSFRCRFHRMIKRSDSLADKTVNSDNSVASPKSVHHQAS